MLHLEELFLQIGAVITAATFLSFLAYKFKQPLMIAYIVAGILIGPSILNLSTETEFFKALSDIGIAFLLFLVGLNLDWKHIKEVGPIALATGVGQVIFTTGVGYFLGLLLGLDATTAIYIGIAFAFSSTIVIVKLLSDKEDLQRLYGRISVGFLIVQDLIAMLILLFLGSIGSGGDLSTILSATFGKWVIVIVALLAFSHWVLPKIVQFAARSQDLLFLFTIAWCFGIAGGLQYLGFGIEIGALLAGISLAGTVYSREMSARIRPLRDFFLVIFFILLGSNLSFDSVQAMLLPSVLLSLFVLIGNPLIVVLIMRSLGYHPRTGFLAGTTVAQISEFSFIVIAAGIAAGHIGDSALTLATMVGLITIGVSSYLITYNEQIYSKIQPIFRPLEAKVKPRREKPGCKPPEVVLIGYDRMGQIILPKIKALKKRYLVIDYNPFITEKLEKRRIPHVYGDASDHMFLSDNMVEEAKFVVSTVPDEQVGLSILSYLDQTDFDGTVILTVRTPEEAEHAYRAGATFVIIPSVLGGERFVDLLSKKKLSQKGWGTLAKQIQDVIKKAG